MDGWLCNTVINRHLFQLFFLSVLQASHSKLVYIYKMHLSWLLKTLEIFSLFFCQLNKCSRELANHRFLLLLHFRKYPNFYRNGISILSYESKLYLMLHLIREKTLKTYREVNIGNIRQPHRYELHAGNFNTLSKPLRNLT